MIYCVAIDDEPIALSIIKEYCSRYGNIQIDCFTSPIEGIEHICNTNPDIVFLDIEMTSHNGIQLAKELPQNTLLIFTTAYSEYALEGFNVNAIDFLHKPIFYPRFIQAMEKAEKWLRKENKSDSTRNTITLKVEHKNVVVDLDSILYVEAMDNYIKVHRRNLPMVLSQITMKEMESLLPSEKFVRVHRSFILHFEAIKSFSNRKIYLNNVEAPIPVGRTYNDSFQNQCVIFNPAINKTK